MPLPNEPTPPQPAPPPAGLPCPAPQRRCRPHSQRRSHRPRDDPQRSRTLPADPDLPTADDPVPRYGHPYAPHRRAGRWRWRRRGTLRPAGPAPTSATRRYRRRPPAKRPNYALRRTIALIIPATLLTTIWFAVKAPRRLRRRPVQRFRRQAGRHDERPGQARCDRGGHPEIPAPAPSPEAKQGTAGASDATSLVRTMRMASQSMSPKSIVAGPGGLLVAQNMMYHHSISVFPRRRGTAQDDPGPGDAQRFGITGHPGVSKGAPVEAAFTPDGKSAWVSNYSMYGSGFGPEGLDSCRKGDRDRHVIRLSGQHLDPGRRCRGAGGAVPKCRDHPRREQGPRR